MRGFPGWLILALVVLSGLMLFVGNEELDKVGPVPLILGVLWSLFTLASIAAKARPEPR
ncbi:MAG: hypothetical protein U0Y82_04795 [Thermoleophilia bacterium]